jgi:DNA-binding beta-propeller fold protein YncE
MKVSRVLPLAAGLLLGASQLAFADVTFTVNDTPGYWFDAGEGWNLTDKDRNKLGGRSLAVIGKGEKVHFTQTVGPKAVESKHTITNLVWPADAHGPVGPMGLYDPANMKDWDVTLTTPGLYVWVCKLHPYMLGAVVVDDPTTNGLDLGEKLVLLGSPYGEPNNQVEFPTYSDIGLRLLRAFFIVTNPSNWKDYTKVGTSYQPKYPAVPVNVGPVVPGSEIVADLNDAIVGKGYDGQSILAPVPPAGKGVGEIWVDTAYELTSGKEDWFPGTATVLSATNWNVTKKIALPQQKMNNGHNFWTSHDQKQIYQTEWHGNSLYVIDRATGKLLQEVELKEKNGKIFCHDPAHVMTRVDTQQVHVGCNGDDTVAEFNRTESGQLKFHQLIKVSKNGDKYQAQPHAHWMGFDGKSMVTPNSNTSDSTLFDFNEYQILDKTFTGTLPIASGMMPDSSKYYVSNYLGDTISVMCGPYPKPAGSCTPGTRIKQLNLLDDNADNPGYISKGRFLDATTPAADLPGPAGGFSVQTPVSPDGKFVVIGNTLSGTITIIDTKTDKLVRSIACDPGCHGVNFGAKKGGGYYAYVTSKFANRLIVLDADPNNDGQAEDAVIVGSVLLANDNPAYKDDTISGNRGMGGQGIMAVPNVYNGWVQKLPDAYKLQLTKKQRNPIGQ